MSPVCKKRFVIPFLLCFLTAAPAADLLTVYQRALQNDPQLQEAEATRLAALESKPQALSALLPQLSGSGLITKERDTGKQDLTENVTVGGGAPVIESFPFNGTVTTQTHKYGVSLKQSIFNWQNWVALKKADRQVAQAEADYQVARQDLISRVAQRYFDVLAAQDNLDALEGALASVNRQLEQAEKRYSVGLIGITDEQEARASHDSSAAAVIGAKRQVAGALEALREITGDTFDTLARPLEPFEPTNPDPISEASWVEMSLAQNLGVVSSRLAADIAQENVSSAEGGHLPTLDFIGSDNKLITNSNSIYGGGEPFGSQSINQMQRSIGIQFSVPLFSGGMVSSQVRQAVYQHRAAKQRVERMSRQAEHDARDAYLGVLSEISRVKALRQAVASNTSALNATQSSYDAGLRSAVDVLESRRLLIQAQTDYSRSRYDYMMNILRLQQAAGILSEESLHRLNDALRSSDRPNLTQ